MFINEQFKPQSADVAPVNPGTVSSQVTISLDIIKQNVNALLARTDFNANDGVMAWIRKAYTEGQLDQLLQNITDKVNAWVNGQRLFVNPVEALRQAFQSITLHPDYLSSPEYVAYKTAKTADEFSANFNEKAIDAAYMAFGKAQGFITQVETALDAYANAHAQTVNEFMAKYLLPKAFAMFKQKYGIDVATSTSPVLTDLQTFKDVANYNLFTPTNSGGLNINGFLSLAQNGDIFVNGFGNVFIDSTKLTTAFDQGMNGLAGTQFKETIAIMAAKIIKGETDAITNIGTISQDNSGEFKTPVFDIAKWATVIPGLDTLLAQHNLTSADILPIYTETATGDAAFRNLQLQLYLKGNGTSNIPASSLLILDKTISLPKNIPSVQRALDKLNEVISSINPNAPVDKPIYESDLHNADPSMTVQEMNKPFVDKVITADQFNQLTGQLTPDQITELTNGIDIPGLTPGSRADHYGVKILMTKNASGHITFTFKLVSPSTSNIPAAAAYNGSLQFKSYASELQDAIGDFHQNPGLWIDELLKGSNTLPRPVTGSSIDLQVQHSYLSGATNVDEIQRRIEDKINQLDPALASRFSVEFGIRHDVQNQVEHLYFYVKIIDKTLGGEPLVKTIDITQRVITNKYVWHGQLMSSAFDSGKELSEIFKQIKPDLAHEADFENPIAGNPVPVNELKFGSQNISELLNALAPYGVKGIDYSNFITRGDAVSEAQRRGETLYLVKDAGDDLERGSVLSISVELTDAYTGNKNTVVVKVFVPLTSRPATLAEINKARNELNQIRDGISRSIEAARKVGKIDDQLETQLKAQLQAVMEGTLDHNVPGSYDGFNTEVNNWRQQHHDAQGNPIEIPYHELISSADDAKHRFDQVRSQIPGDMAPAELIKKLEDILGIKLDAEMLGLVAKYADVILDYLEHNHPNAEELLNFLKNPNMMQWLSKIPPELRTKVFNATQWVSSNYKYAYFGTGAALGAAGVGAGIGAVATAIAAQKAKKIKTHKIKLRSHKFITIMTSIVSALSLGGSAALMILFFTQQGGF